MTIDNQAVVMSRRSNLKFHFSSRTQIERHGVVRGKIFQSQCTDTVATRFEASIYVDIIGNISCTTDSCTFKHKNKSSFFGISGSSGQAFGFSFLDIVIDQQFTSENLNATRDKVVVIGERISSGTFFDDT